MKGPSHRDRGARCAFFGFLALCAAAGFLAGAASVSRETDDVIQLESRIAAFRETGVSDVAMKDVHVRDLRFTSPLPVDDDLPADLRDFSIPGRRGNEDPAISAVFMDVPELETEEPDARSDRAGSSGGLLGDLGSLRAGDAKRESRSGWGWLTDGIQENRRQLGAPSQRAEGWSTPEFSPLEDRQRFSPVIGPTVGVGGFDTEPESE